MTLRQNMATVPEQARWDPRPAASGTTVTTFFVDARGLPHRVVESSRDGHRRVSEVFRFTGWGSKVTVVAPSGPVIGAKYAWTIVYLLVAAVAADAGAVR